MVLLTTVFILISICLLSEGRTRVIQDRHPYVLPYGLRDREPARIYWPQTGLKESCQSLYCCYCYSDCQNGHDKNQSWLNELVAAIKEQKDCQLIPARAAPDLGCLNLMESMKWVGNDRSHRTRRKRRQPNLTENGHPRFSAESS